MRKTALYFLCGVLFLFTLMAYHPLYAEWFQGLMRESTTKTISNSWVKHEGVIMFDEIIKLAKALQWERRIATGLICQGPGILFHASLVSDQVGVVDGIIYDGTSTAGDIMLDMAAVDDASDRLNLWPGRYFKKGLYVVGTANVESITVGFMPIKD